VNQKTNQDLVGDDVCEHELARFADAYDLDLNPTDADDKKKLDDSKAILIRAMKRGRLVIDADGNPVYTATGGEVFKFKQWTGATLMNAQGVSDTHQVTKLHRMLAEVTGRDATAFAKLAGPEYRVVTTLFTLFFTAT
jgi:hypothetical protein